MVARGLRFKSDGTTFNNEEARMLVPVGFEGIVPVLSAVQSVRWCYPGFCRRVGQMQQYAGTPDSTSNVEKKMKVRKVRQAG